MAATNILEEEHRKRALLARVLYFTEQGTALPSDPEDRNSAFQAVKKDMLKKAVQLERRLDKAGYKIVPAE
jgi:hypothetical protein